MQDVWWTAKESMSNGLGPSMAKSHGAHASLTQCSMIDTGAMSIAHRFTKLPHIPAIGRAFSLVDDTRMEFLANHCCSKHGHASLFRVGLWDSNCAGSSIRDGALKGRAKTFVVLISIDHSLAIGDAQHLFFRDNSFGNVIDDIGVIAVHQGLVGLLVML